jgi:hypothetical protein
MTLSCWLRTRFQASSPAHDSNSERMTSSRLAQKNNHRALKYHTCLRSLSRIKCSVWTACVVLSAVDAPVTIVSLTYR